VIKFEGGRSRSVRTIEEEVGLLQSKWEAFSPQQKELIMEMLKGGEASDALMQQIYNSHYIRNPVDIDTFLDDEYYSGPGGVSVYPKLREDLREIFSGKYSEVIFTGSIGYGKSFVATYATMYSMYRLTCLRDPQTTFSLASGSKIWFAFLSVHKKHAGETIFEDMRSKIEASPYFYEVAKDSIRTPPRFAKYQAIITKDIQLIADSASNPQLIGKNVFGAVMDEVNFGDAARVADDKQRASINTAKIPVTKAEKTYRGLIARINSRFMKMGTTPGLVFVISSKNNESDFTAKRIVESTNDPRVYVVDYAEWETKPSSKYSGRKFRVFFGGRTQPSRILKEDEEVLKSSFDDELQRVIDVPIEFQDQFDKDIEVALRDIGGIAVPRVMPFISQNHRIHDMYRDRRDYPLKSDYWVCGKDSSPFRWDVLCSSRLTRLLAGVEEEVFIPRINPNAARHIHIDPSLYHDATGFVMGHVEKAVEVVLRDPHTQEYYKELVPLIYIDLAFQIKAPEGGEIDLSQIRRLIYELTNHGFSITYISMDVHQSADMIQQLKKQGYSAELRSLDKTNVGYEALKNALYQQRLRCYKYDALITELENLQYDSNKDRVDHPIQLANGRPGSKDVSDALAGVIWSLTDLQTGAPPVMPLDRSLVDSQHPLEQWVDIGGRPSSDGPSVDGNPLFDIPFLFGDE